MPKYYTNFCFEGYKPQEFHCTHIYFGELKDNKVKEIIGIIKSYFENHSLIKKNLEFNEKTQFGEKHDRAVLLLEKCEVDLYLDLRSLLSVGLQNVTPFRPHVTTNLSNFTGVVDRYSLVKVENKLVEEVYSVSAL